MLALRDRVARRLAGNDALYWRRREFGYPSQSRVDLLLGHRLDALEKSVVVVDADTVQDAMLDFPG
jgi:hypothetical protein